MQFFYRAFSYKSGYLYKRVVPMVLLAYFWVELKPARAGVLDFLNAGSFGNISSQLKILFPQINSLTQWVSLLQNSINDPCKATPILLSSPGVAGWCTSATGIFNGNGSISSILKNSTGVMGLPNTSQARSTISQTVNSAGTSPDLFLNNPTQYSLQLGNLSDRVATSLNSQTVLSNQGQQEMQNELDQTSQALVSIANSSDEAQGATSTQEVVKAIARINAQQAIISGMAQVSALRNRTDAQFTNLNLANISDGIDQQNRQKMASSTVDSYSLLNLCAQSNLF